MKQLNFHPTLQRACVTFWLCVWICMFVSEVMHRPRNLTSPTFYLVKLLFMLYSVGPIVIVLAIGTYAIRQNRSWLMILLWFVVPTGFILVNMINVRHFHGFNVKDWTPLLLFSTVLLIACYFRYLAKLKPDQVLFDPKTN